LSKDIATPKISRRFIIFPTPKYRNSKKQIIARENKTPLLLLSRIMERVKIKQENKLRKNRGRAPGMKGLMK